MLSGVTAVVLLVVASLPGAVCMWSFERKGGQYGLRRSDRVLWFIGLSTVFFAIVSWPLYQLRARYWDAAIAGDSLPWWLYIIPVAYLGIPALLGYIVGWSLDQQKNWAQAMTGSDRPPRAWDHHFGNRPEGLYILRLKSGRWVGGLYTSAGTRRSFAAAYPETPDLYFATSVAVDPETGAPRRDDKGRIEKNESGLYLRGEEIEYMVFVDPLAASLDVHYTADQLAEQLEQM